MRINLNSSIIPDGNFYWHEATRNGERMPESPDVERNIIKIAQALEEVREFLGNKPMRIHSWYRPPRINRAVGGASHSRHILGDAVDFSIQGENPLAIYDKLDEWWGSRGGLGKSSQFTHIDLRGTRSRWTY